MAMSISDHSIYCSIARALNEVGEKWSLLIIREAIMGTKRFDEFQQRLGTARNILNDRLTRLVYSEVLSRMQSEGNARIFNYELTAKGRELLSALATLIHWGDRWIHAKIEPPIVLIDKTTKQPIRQMLLTAADGRTLRSENVEVTPGPGASKKIRQRLI
jgi:DNA-binding HxlR family transcriptional regulator